MNDKNKKKIQIEEDELRPLNAQEMSAAQGAGKIFGWSDGDTMEEFRLFGIRFGKRCKNPVPS